jgi:hypothetical protein
VGLLARGILAATATSRVLMEIVIRAKNTKVDPSVRAVTQEAGEAHPLRSRFEVSEIRNPRSTTTTV